MQVRNKIHEALQNVTEEKNVHIEFPQSMDNGDYSSNIAMQIASKEKKDPRKAAEEIVSKLSKDNNLKNYISKIEVAGPGFINFWIKKEVLTDNLKTVNTRGDKYGKSDLFQGKRIMFEFGQPNTHKMPHIGHLFSYIYGESMSRFLEATGAEVFRANYQGDVGLHVAKCLWAFQKEKPLIPEGLEDKVKLLQEMYQNGSKAYKDDEKIQEEIKTLNRLIYAKDPEILDLWQETREWSVEFYKHFEERLGIVYNKYYFESEVYEKGIEEVKRNLNDVFTKSERAVIFEGSKYGLHDRVFITSYGTPTYEAKELALEQMKMKDWPYDLLIISTAAEQNEYFKVVFKALEEIDPLLKGRLEHIGFGMIQLKEGKMGSRTGNIVGAVELVDTIVREIREIVESREDLNEIEKASISEIVGIGAVKYAFLKTNPVQDIIFDIKSSISTEGNSGPYVQYTVARASNVLVKALGANYKDLKGLENNNIEINQEEDLLLRKLYRYQEEIESVAKTYSPNTFINYIYDLAQTYNTFYNKHHMIGSDNQNFRLALTNGVRQVLENGLNLLGIKVPTKM